MKDLDANELLTRAAGGKLSQAEETALEDFLRRQPAFGEKLDEERSLNALLQELPSAPLSTNFTSLVLEAARQEGRRSEVRVRNRELSFLGRVRKFGVRIAGAAAGIALIAFATMHHLKAERGDMAQSVRSFTEVASVIGGGTTPPEQLFQDFESIQRLSLPEHSDLDLELLVALQK